MARPGAPRRAVVVLGALAPAGALVAGLAPAAAAAPPACRVKNPTQDTWFATWSGQALTRAIAAANPGDRLNVFGRCRGSFSIGKDLSVFGTTNRLDPTILDGGGREGVLFVNERVTVTLTLNDSRLTANTARGGGGGLFSEGVATLNRSRVTGNTAAYGGGILSVNTLPLNQTVVSGQRPRQLRLLAAVTGL
jgi:hypothetical protein